MVVSEHNYDTFCAFLWSYLALFASHAQVDYHLSSSSQSKAEEHSARPVSPAPEQNTFVKSDHVTTRAIATYTWVQKAARNNKMKQNEHLSMLVEPLSLYYGKEDVSYPRSAHHVSENSKGFNVLLASCELYSAKKAIFSCHSFYYFSSALSNGTFVGISRILKLRSYM